jgi:hypothetical protein
MMFQLPSYLESVFKGIRKVRGLVYAGGRLCVNSVIRPGVRLVWNVVRRLPKLVRVCMNLIIIGCALVVFLCVTLFRVTVAVIYRYASRQHCVNDDDVLSKSYKVSGGKHVQDV